MEQHRLLINNQAGAESKMAEIYGLEDHMCATDEDSEAFRATCTCVDELTAKPAWAAWTE